jgi:hypothetical protein
MSRGVFWGLMAGSGALLGAAALTGATIPLIFAVMLCLAVIAHRQRL